MREVQFKHKAACHEKLNNTKNETQLEFCSAVGSKVVESVMLNKLYPE
jgi:hypothetical protein